MRLDVAIGMALSQLIMWSVITTTAGSLHTHGIADIETVAQAATALQPLVNTFPYAGLYDEDDFCTWYSWYWIIGSTSNGWSIWICFV
jgi:Natural resistance-associated macrophage protein